MALMIGQRNIEMTIKFLRRETADFDQNIKQNDFMPHPEIPFHSNLPHYRHKVVSNPEIENIFKIDCHSAQRASMKPRSSLIFVAVALLALGTATTAVLAKDSLKTIMKSWKPQNALAKDLISGATPYDPAAAKGILQLYLAGQTDLSGRISPNSPEGKDMLARFDQFGTDLRAALANLQNRDTFKAAYAKVAANCGSCHDKYAN